MDDYRPREVDDAEVAVPVGEDEAAGEQVGRERPLELRVLGSRGVDSGPAAAGSASFSPRSESASANPVIARRAATRTIVDDRNPLPLPGEIGGDSRETNRVATSVHRVEEDGPTAGHGDPAAVGRPGGCVAGEALLTVTR